MSRFKTEIEETGYKYILLPHGTLANWFVGNKQLSNCSRKASNFNVADWL